MRRREVDESKAPVCPSRPPGWEDTRDKKRKKRKKKKKKKKERVGIEERGLAVRSKCAQTGSWLTALAGSKGIG